MEKFFSDFKQMFSGAVKKSGEVVELTKLRLAVADTKNAIRSNYEKLGEMAYLASKDVPTPECEAEKLIIEIDELKETLKLQELKVAELANKKICSNCGKMTPEDASFCSACGNPFGSAE